MSYSFSVSAPTKDEAKAQVQQQFDNIVMQQPEHAADRTAANGTVEAYIDLAAEPTGTQQIHVTAFGSLSSTPSGDDGTSDVRIGGATLNVSVSVA